MIRLLVADDDPGVQKLLEITLQLEGFDVHIVENGREALSAAHSSGYDLAVVDVMMPFVDGIAVCEQLKNDPITAGLPIILLSAKAQRHDIEAGRAAGADLYMTKPFDPAALVEAVHRLVG